MPTYEYECGECGSSYEIFQSMSEEPKKKCDKCGQNSLRRLISGGTGIIFKGSGFTIGADAQREQKKTQEISDNKNTKENTKSDDKKKDGDGKKDSVPGNKENKQKKKETIKS